MGTTNNDFTALLDHLAGRGDPAVARRLDADPAFAARAEAARRLLDAGRRAAAAPRPTRRLLARAARVFRDARAPAAPTLLECLLDTLRSPRPALSLRRGRPAPVQPRFLRYGGALTVELQVVPKTRGVEVRGQVTPADAAPAVVAQAGGRERRAPVGADGTFRFATLPRGPVSFGVGPARIADLEL